MDQDPRTTGAAVSASEQEETQQRTPEQIRAEIETTREELGDTVEALAAKTDVKARVHERVEDTKQAAREKVEGTRTAAQEKISDAASKAPPSAQEGAATVIEKIRANPIPFAAGAALLLAFFIGRRSAMP